MENKNNKNQKNNNQKVEKEQVDHKGIKLPIFFYHFPNGTKGLMLHLNDIDEVEVIPVYPPAETKED